MERAMNIVNIVAALHSHCMKPCALLVIPARAAAVLFIDK